MNEQNTFDIPVVLILFKRKDTVLQIVEKLRQARVNKIYLISDQGRNSEEIKRVNETRRAIEQAIDWECTVIKNYAEENRGVYGNIALGAKWVFEREKYAIFLEDDNLPELTFFPYCKELLNRYENDTRIMWICGTNYLGKYQAQDGASYMFTKHMLPCGWASWSKKFLKYYDGKIEKFRDPYVRERFFKDFPNKAMLDVYAAPLLRYEKEIDQGKNPYSWDYQMCLTVRTNSMFGISPVCNQIRNIGVDMDSEHGGNSMNKVMTRRFCGMPSYPLEFPLKHPKAVMTDLEYESRINKIVTPPFYMRVRHMIDKSIKFLMMKNQYEPLFKKR